VSLSRVLLGDEKWRNEGRGVCVNLGGIASCDEPQEVAVVGWEAIVSGSTIRAGRATDECMVVVCAQWSESESQDCFCFTT